MSPQSKLTLTEEEKWLVRQSFESAQVYADSLTKLFYGRLFDLRPELRALFKVGIEEQSRKLLDTLRIVVDALDRFDDLRPQLAELGRKHVDYGAKPEHYDLVRTTLIWTFSQALGFEFDRSTKAAWDHVLRAVAAVMLEGAYSEPTKNRE
jgi:hemoglobin-like flavoprotein